jgi:hypothetical protein
MDKATTTDQMMSVLERNLIDIKNDDQIAFIKKFL